MKSKKNKLDMIILQIDMANQKEAVSYVKGYIDMAKENGYNTVFLWLKAAVKVECVSFFNDDETYTPDEIREIVAYGNERGIEIIPGMERFAHINGFLRFPQLAFLAECQDAEVEGRGYYTGLGNTVCVSNEKAVQFLDTYYSQVMSLFTSQYVHVGMDESFDFAVCPKCSERLANGATKQDMFYEYLMHTYDLVKSHGKTMMMWDDLFEYMDVSERLPRDIIMCNWNYVYITDMPRGHLINRKKKDWFRHYDQLGFRYIFCTSAQATSKTYNLDSFTNYAMKYNPMGGLMTIWQRANKFNLAGYPIIAYAGKLWNGKATKEDRLKIYTEVLGDEEAADVVLRLSGSGSSRQSSSLRLCENGTLESELGTEIEDYAVRKLRAAWEKMEEGLQKDILIDIYTITLDAYLNNRTHQICLEVFDNYETRAKKPAYFIKQLQQLKDLSNEAYALNKVLWEKYRPGIKSFENRFDKKYVGRAKNYDNMIAELEKNEKHGVFYAELMLHCVYGTPRMMIEIVYKDKSIPTTVYKTMSKVAGGVNTIRFAMENKPIDYVIFTAYGEGSTYPVHFRYTYGGKMYVVSSVTKLCGEVKNIKRILENDTQFAEMGTNDGQVHYENIAVSRVEHKIKLKFKKFR